MADGLLLLFFFLMSSKFQIPNPKSTLIEYYAYSYYVEYGIPCRIRVSSLGVKITPPPRRLPWTYPPAYLGLGVLAKYAVSEKLPSG